MIRVSVRHSNTFRQRLDAINLRMAYRAEAALFSVAREIYELSRAYVPIDTHTLLETATIRQDGLGFLSEFYVGYGTPGVVSVEYSQKERKLVTRIPYEYAFYVHEVTGNRHDFGRRDHFLTEPINMFWTELQHLFMQVMA